MFLSVPANLGYAALAGLIAGESAGLPIPGETALIGAGLLAADGRLSVPIVIGVAALAAMIGDNVGYWVGRRAGRRALQAHRGPFRHHRQRLLERGEVFFARHGIKAVILARFLAGLRVVGAVVAGASHMPAGRFLAANAVGAVAWAASTVLLVVWLGPAGALIAFASGWTLAGAGLLIGTLAAWRTRRRQRRVPLAAGA